MQEPDERPITITSFFGIFEQKLQRLRHDIKMLRKDKKRREHVKKCIKEAKELKTILNSAAPTRKHHDVRLVINEHTATIDGLPSNVAINIKKIAHDGDRKVVVDLALQI